MLMGTPQGMGFPLKEHTRPLSLIRVWYRFQGGPHTKIFYFFYKQHEVTPKFHTRPLSGYVIWLTWKVGGSMRALIPPHPRP